MQDTLKCPHIEVTGAHSPGSVLEAYCLGINTLHVLDETGRY